MNLKGVFLLHVALDRKNQPFKHSICYHQKAMGWSSDQNHITFNLQHDTQRCCKTQMTEAEDA